MDEKTVRSFGTIVCTMGNLNCAVCYENQNNILYALAK